MLPELMRFTVDNDEPRPFAVTVPLIKTVGWDHGTTVTRPSTLEIESEL